MINILKNIALKPYNSFGINVYAKLFTSLDSVGCLHELIETKEYKNNNILILGGGSNVLFTKNQDCLVLLNKIKGIKIEKEDEESYIVSAGGGENWHEFVMFCINNNLSGVENLSLIPGSVGASPIQNIGAYGVEIKDVFEWLDAFNIKTGEVHRFYKKDCNFGYRNSVFKNEFKNEYIIVKVAYKLQKKATINTSYGAINNMLEKMSINNPTIKDVSNAVISIRQSKLPDPKKLGNSGSFFKNPIVANEKTELLKEKYPNIPIYKINSNLSKIAAGWLIEQAGWKGKIFDGRYGVHKKQALVLVNYGNATGKEIYNLSEEIIDSIKLRFNIDLEREVNVL